MISLSNPFSRSTTSNKLAGASNSNKYNSILNNNLIKLFLLTVILHCLIQVGLEIVLLKLALDGLRGIQTIQNNDLKVGLFLRF